MNIPGFIKNISYKKEKNANYNFNADLMLNKKPFQEVLHAK
jgi:hypothetical protein